MMNLRRIRVMLPMLLLFVTAPASAQIVSGVMTVTGAEMH